MKIMSALLRPPQQEEPDAVDHSPDVATPHPMASVVEWLLSSPPVPLVGTREQLDVGDVVRARYLARFVEQVRRGSPSTRTGRAIAFALIAGRGSRAAYTPNQWNQAEWWCERAGDSAGSIWRKALRDAWGGRTPVTVEDNGAVITVHLLDDPKQRDVLGLG